MIGIVRIRFKNDSTSDTVDLMTNSHKTPLTDDFPEKLIPSAY